MPEVKDWFLVTVGDDPVSLSPTRVGGDDIAARAVVKLMNSGWRPLTIDADETGYRAALMSTDEQLVTIESQGVRVVAAVCPVCKKLRNIIVWDDNLQCHVCRTKGSPEEFGLDG